MSIPSFTKPRSPRSRLMASAAVMALIASGVAGDRLLAQTPAHAAAVMTSDLSNQSMPSFAPLVARVKPAVVSVRVNIENVSGQDEAANPASPQQDIPPQLRQFFRGEQNGMDPRQITPQPTIGLGSGFFISSDG